MNAPEQSDYIVQCLRTAGSMYEKDARAFLAEHDAGVRTKALHEALDSIRACLRLGGMQQKGLIVARKRILALIEGTIPEPPRRNVSHKQVAERCRQQPGAWLPVGEYANDQSAHGIVAAIAKGGSSVLAYLPAGAFEGRSERTETGTLVQARYVGPAVEAGGS